MDDILSIKLNIAERFYSIKIKSDEEAKVRMAAKTINDKLRSLKDNLPNKDMQDWLAVACLWFVIELIDTQGKANTAVKGIEDFEKMVTEYLDCLNDSE